MSRAVKSSGFAYFVYFAVVPPSRPGTKTAPNCTLLGLFISRNPWKQRTFDQELHLFPTSDLRPLACAICPPVPLLLSALFFVPEGYGRLRKATEGYGRIFAQATADPALTMTGPTVQRLLNPPVSRISCISRLLCSRLSLLCALCFLLFKAFRPNAP